MQQDDDDRIAFIGGGNMAGAVIGGLVAAGRAAARIQVVEPADAPREALHRRYGVQVLAAGGPALAGAALVVWAVKPQAFAEAAAGCAPHVAGALQLSVMAGIRSDAVARASGSEAVVRAMPNTPALIGQGISGLYARPAVGAAQRAAAEAVLGPTGRLLWFDDEAQLDAVTALSGSGPAYVYYVLEAMMAAAQAMGLTPEQGRALALGTFAGATALAEASPLEPAVLRAQVTSKGGTTQAAIESLDAHGVQAAFVTALQAARQRAAELGDAFG